MPIGKIRKDFKAKLRESAKAILFLDFDGREYWVPKSVCTLIKEKNGLVVATLAAFKFEEITGIEPEDMTTPFVSMGGLPLVQHRLDICILESTPYPLMEAQRRQLVIAVKCRYNYLFWEAGTGKTLAALTLSASYLAAGIIDSIVILCPASLQGQWKEKAADYFPDMPVQILSIEANSFSTSLPKMLAKFDNIPGRKHLIVDESHLVKNIGAKRTKNIDRYYKADCVTCCTATAVGRNASDLFYQYSLSDRDIIGCENFNGFAKNFLLFGGNDGDKVVAYQNTKALSERIAPYTFFLTKKEIRPDMPVKLYHKVYYDLEDRQRLAINAVNGLIAQVQAKTKHGFIPKEKTYQITSFLQKLTCGFIPDEEELRLIFGNLGLLGEAADNVAKIKTIRYEVQNARVQTIQKITADFPKQQCIIWCSFRDELAALQLVYKDNRTFTGGMSQRLISATVKDFKAGKFQYLIAMQQMGTGFDLPWCNKVIYSTTIFDSIKREQSIDRVHRINTQDDCDIHDVVARGSIDERIHQVLEYKQEIAAIFKTPAPSVVLSHFDT